MLGSFLLLSLAPAAPVPKAPPPPDPVVEVTAKRYAYPPQVVPGPNGALMLYPVDDGLFLEVIVRNVSKEVIYAPYWNKPVERFDVKVFNAKGEEVSEKGRHIGFRRANAMPKSLELRPGESFTVVVHLEQDWPDDLDRRAPGKYTARAVFESGDIKGESAATFELEILK